jgi:predicted transcriptional regulator
MTTTKGKAIVYRTTEKGKSFLERYEELKKLLK